METSPTIGEIAKALGQFQYSVGAITKDAVNPFFKSKYASFENITTHIKDPLSKNKLTYSQFPDGDGLTTILMHESGEWIRATAKLTIKDQTPQGQGSAITYMRRYALAAALGLATEDDDDGNAATHTKAPAKAPIKRKEPESSHIDFKKKLINELAAQLGHPMTKENAGYVIKDLTGIELAISNFDAILEILTAKVEATDPLKK